MATKIWDSSDGNWGAAGSWSPSGVPIDNDIVMFPTDNYQDVTSGLDQSGVDLDSLLIREGCTVVIGSTASPLIIAADLIKHEGEGTLYLTPEGGETVDQLLVASPNWDGDGSVQIVSIPAGASIARLTVMKGKVSTSGTHTGGIVQVEMSYQRQVNDALIDFSGSSTPPAISLLYMNGGHCLDADPSIVYLVDGVVRTPSTGSAFVLTQYGGIFDWRDASTKDVTLMGGIFTSINDLRPKTITSLEVWPSALADLHENVTVTSGGNLLNRPITG